MKGTTLRYYHTIKQATYDTYEVCKPCFDKHGRFKYFLTEQIDSRQFYTATYGIEPEVLTIEGVNADCTKIMYWVTI